MRDDATAANPWGLRFLRMLDMATDSDSFETGEDLSRMSAAFDGWMWAKNSSTWLPLYEAKMLHHYNHRHGDYALATRTPGKEVRQLPAPSVDQLDNPDYEVVGRYWVADEKIESAIPDTWTTDWLLGWRDVATGLDVRTFITSVLPRSAVNHKFPIVILSNPSLGPLLQATWSSLIFDYVARQKLSGSGMTYFIVKQLTCPTPEVFQSPAIFAPHVPLGDWVCARILELTYTSYRMRPYAIDDMCLQQDQDPGTPFRWAQDRRALLLAELDAAMFVLYGLDRGEIEHVLDSSPILRRCENRDNGEFLTKRLVLEIYDAMVQAAGAGASYQTVLDPPPGDGLRHPAHSATVGGVS